jgi:hypothetical protein
VSDFQPHLPGLTTHHRLLAFIWLKKLVLFVLKMFGPLALYFSFFLMSLSHCHKQTFSQKIPIRHCYPIASHLEQKVY